MLKCLFAFPRAEGLTRAQSLDHYYNRHAPTVHGVPEFRREMKRYIQNNILGKEAGIPDELDIAIVDGVSEVWFTDIDTMTSLFDVPAYMEIIRPDELRFSDGSKLRLVVAEENVLSGGGDSPKIKLMTFLAKSDGVSSEDAQNFWLDVYGPAILKSEEFRKLGRGYIQNYSIGKSRMPFPPEYEFEGVEEIWFDDVASLAAYMKAHARIEKETGASKYFDAAESMRFATSATLMPGWGQ